MNSALLNSVAALVEKASRPGVLGAPGQKAERSLARDLKAYFREIAVPIERLRLEDKQYVTSVEKPNLEIVRHAVRAALHVILIRHRPSLETALKVGMQDGWTRAAKLQVMHEADGPAQGSLFDEIDYLGQTAKKAADWAAEQAAELVVGIDDTTVDLIASAIEQGIENQLGSAATGRLIRQELLDMSVSRAMTIAATEINRAMSAAFLDKLDAVGVEYKQWIPDADPCEICLGNVDQGAIPLDEDFESGDDAPPAHPNCRCAVAGARIPEED